MQQPISPITVFAFNGDADGIFAQHILELGGTRPDIRITGVKRDIRLVERVPEPWSPAMNLRVFDISMDANRQALNQLLEAGVHVEWYDHHEPGLIPVHTNLRCSIRTEATVCTGILVHEALGGSHGAWAAAAAFGDNFDTVAEALATAESFDKDQVDALRRLGRLINYNGYGERLEDLHFDPMIIAEIIAPFSTPFEFIESTTLLDELQERFEKDRSLAAAVPPLYADGKVEAYVFPQQAWARRYASTHVNELVRSRPETAFAALMETQGGFVVSIRSPRGSNRSAAELARRFASGGGRLSAAGINHLDSDDLERFLDMYRSHFN